MPPFVSEEDKRARKGAARSAVAAATETSAPPRSALHPNAPSMPAKDRIPDDCCVVDGQLYDLKGFMKVHPGGEHMLRFMGGYDLTAQYYSYHDHSNNPRAATTLGKFRVGDWAGKKVDREDIDNADFRELKAEVAKVLPPGKQFANAEFYLKATVLILVTLATEVYTLLNGPSLPRNIFWGWLLALVNLNIQHDANHGAVSRKAWINRLLGYTLDWAGGSSLNWRVQHVLFHHAETNVPGLDPDHDLHPIGRLHKFSPRRTWMSLQWLYIPLLYTVLPLQWVFVDVRVLITSMYKRRPISSLATIDRIIGLAFRLFFWTRFFIIPLINYPSLYSVFCIWCTMAVAGSYLGFFFAISHNFEGVPSYKATKDSWFARQIEG